MKASVITLGCKINQCESESIATILEGKGYAVENVETNADLFVVNTCAVTAEAERKSRQTVRRLAEAGLDVTSVLAKSDSYHALDACGGLVRTGPTGTNVNDVALVLVGG